jgi:hypothetical protein
MPPLEEAEPVVPEALPELPPLDGESASLAATGSAANRKDHLLNMHHISVGNPLKFQPHDLFAFAL